MRETQRDTLVRGNLTRSDSPVQPELDRRTRRFRGHHRVRTLESFQHRNFRLLWAAMLGASATSWLVSVVIGWLTFRLTGSPLMTALAIGMGALPHVFVGPIAGVLIDAWDRQKILAASLASWAAFTAGFGAIVIADAVAPWHIFVFALLTGVAGSLLVPAEQALIANIVPKRLFINAYSLVALASSVSRLVAPALTGFSILLIGVGETLMLAVILLLVATKVSLMIDGRNGNRHPVRPRTLVSDLTEAARYMKNTRMVLGLMVLLSSSILLIAPINIGLMPVYAAEVFSGGPQVLGLLVAALGAGMTIGTVLLASMGEIKRQGLVIGVAAGLTAVGLLAFSQSKTLAVAFPVLAFYGATMVVVYTMGGAAIQSVVPDHLRGRVAALTAATFAVFPIGALIVGGLAQLYGAPLATLVSATLFAVILLLLPVVFHGVWSFRIDDAEEHSGGAETVTETIEPAGV